MPILHILSLEKSLVIDAFNWINRGKLQHLPDSNFYVAFLFPIKLKRKYSIEKEREREREMMRERERERKKEREREREREREMHP